MDKELAESIGKAAREARNALELTQADTADRIGVTAEFYARIERGNALPSVQTLSRITTSLGVSADHLLGRVEAPRSAQLAAKLRPVDPPDEPAEVRRLLRRLRKASPGTLRVVSLLLKALDQKR